MTLTKTVVAFQIMTAVACWIGVVIFSDRFEKMILMAMAISATIIAIGNLKTYIEVAEIDKLRKEEAELREKEDETDKA